MNIIINNNPEIIPDEIETISQLVEWKNLNSDALAIAVDNKIVRKLSWDSTKLTENSNLTIFSAAFGG